MQCDFKVNASKRAGKFIVYESGGGMSASGVAFIVCGKDGEALPATSQVDMNRGISNGRHASFICDEGVRIIRATYGHGQTRISVAEILGFEPYSPGRDDPCLALCKIVARYDDGIWDPELPNNFCEDAITAARNKCRDYHCRSAYYFK